MNKIKKILAVCAACAMGISCVSCDKNKDKSEQGSGGLVDTADLKDYSISQDEMPYGSTLSELKPASDENVKIAIEYDNRFLEMEEAYVISEYMWALSQKDEASIRKTFYPDLLDYTVKVAQMESAEEYINASYDNLAEALGGDFEFSYLDITAVEYEADTKETFDNVDEGLNFCSDDDILGKVSSKKCVTLEGYTMFKLSDGTEKLVSGVLSSPISLCIYKIDGQYYIV